MMLAGIPVAPAAVAELASMVRAIGADELADRLDRAVDDGVALLALTIDERSIILNAHDDPSPELSELRGVLVQEHQWRLAAGPRLVAPIQGVSQSTRAGPAP